MSWPAKIYCPYCGDSLDVEDGQCNNCSSVDDEMDLIYAEHEDDAFLSTHKMVKCPHCSVRTPEGDKYCSYCGEAI